MPDAVKKVKIYHNPRCGKSRTALKAMEEAGFEVEVIEYLKKAPSVKELNDLLVRLNLKPMDIIRTGEELFKEKFRSLDLTDAEWVSVIHENPILLQRPILVKGPRAVVARDEESIARMLR